VLTIVFVFTVVLLGAGLELTGGEDIFLLANHFALD
jgi:hypothetical protein